MIRERSTRRKEYELTRDTGKIKLQKQRKKITGEAGKTLYRTQGQALNGHRDFWGYRTVK